MKINSRYIQKLFIVLLCCTVILTFYPATMMAFAEDSNSNTSGFNVQGSKTAAPTLLGADRETTVTLQLPTGEYQNKVDIVFVMDNSTSVANSGYNFSDNAESLFNSIVENNPGVDLKVAVIKYRGYATDMLGSGLTKYEGNEESIMTAIRNNTVPGSGSNAHSGLIMADQILKEDAEVEDSNKYVVFLTDGKNYIWNNDNNEPVTYYTQYAEKTSVKNDGKPTLNQKAGNYNKEQGKVYCTVPQIPDREPVNFVDEDYKADGKTSAYYARLYGSDNSELSSTNTKYDFPAYYSKYYAAEEYTGNTTIGDGTVDPKTLTNGASIFNINGQQPWRVYYDYVPQEGTFWENVNYLQLNPYEVIENDDGTYSYDTSKVNEDFFLWHPDAMQKGTYLVGHYWKENIVANYNAASISYAPGSGGGTNLADSFHHWLLETSDFGANIKDSDQVAELFTDIDNSIRYMVGSGVVTDEIADEFELKVPEGSEPPFRMTYNGTPLDAQADGDNKWNFGEADDDGVFPYVVEYEESSSTITWKINVPIENLKPVTLSYDLILKEEYVKTEETTYETNKSAVLDYTSTDGKYEGQYEFEKPEVKYWEKEIEATKVWDDDNDRDGKRDDVTFVLKANGEEADTKDIAKNATGEALTVKWDKLPAYADEEEIEYTVEEKDAVDGKITMNRAEYAVNVEGDAESGFTITNSYAPETTTVTIEKVWDGPEAEATFTLKAGEETVGTVTLPDEDGENTYTWTNLKKYKAGQEITYSVTEAGIDNYETSGPIGTGTQSDPFVFTNTYKASGKANIKVTKALAGTGAKWPGGQTLTLTAKGSEGAPTPEKTAVNITEAGEADFGWIAFDESDIGKEYTYTISEGEGFTTGGWTGSGDITATVKVTDKGDGELEAAVTYSPEDATITNTYKTEPVSVDLEAAKSLAGRKLGKDEFSFKLSGSDVSETKKNDEAGAVKFSTISYDKAGTYTYTIEEVKGDLEKVSYDEHKVNVSVEVTDDGKGNLSAEVKYDGKDSVPVFENEYTPDPEEVNISVNKKLTGRDLKAGEFEFTLDLSDFTAAEEADDDSQAEAEPVSLTASNDANGLVNFETITFEKAGTYVFEIKEKKGSAGGVTYDDSTIKVTVEVTYDDAEGEFKTSVKYPDDITFENTYKPEPATVTPEVTKALNGRALKEGEFSFTLSGSGVNETVKNAADGSVKFSPITYDKEGTFTYSIKEDSGDLDRVSYDTHEVKLTVTVSDDKSGKLAAEATYDGTKTFVNEYAPEPEPVSIDPPVRKIVQGTPDEVETYTFEMKAGDSSFPMPDAAGGAMSMIVNIEGEGEREFGQIDFTEPGTYWYTVTEVAGDNPDCEYDSSVYKVTAVVTEDPDTHKLSKKVTYEKSGEQVDIAVFEFTNIYADESEEPDDPEKPDKPNKPKTGDTNDLAGMLGLMGASAAGLLYMIFRRRRGDNI